MTEDKVSVQGSPNQGLFGATLGFFFGFAAVSLFGPTAIKFKDILGLSPQMLGLLVAMPALSGSILRIPFSAWVDSAGGRKPFLTLMIIAIVGLIGLSGLVYFIFENQSFASQNKALLYYLTLFFGLLSGCGIATFSVGISQVSYWFPQKKQGFALGTYAGLGNLAPGIFSFLLPISLVNFGIINSYFIWLAFLIIGTVLYFITGKDSYYFQMLKMGYSREKAMEFAKSCGQELCPAKSLIDSLKLSAKTVRTWLLVILYFTTFGGFMALTAWFPTYWTQYFKVDLFIAGTLTATYSILTSVVRIFGGVIADKIGGINTSIISLVFMAVGSLGILFIRNIEFCVLSMIIMAIGMGVNNAAVFKLVPKLVSNAVGGASGWVGGLGAFGGFAIPPLLGAFVARGGSDGYREGFLVFLLLAIFSIAIDIILKNMAKE